MTQQPRLADGPVVLDLDGLQSLLDALGTHGYSVVGPTVRDGAVVPGPVSSVHDLPAGFGDEQAPGRYRLTDGGRELFGYAAAAVSWKAYLLPASRVLWRIEPRPPDAEGEPTADPVPEPVAPARPTPRQALVGVRACDLHAIEVQDRVLLGRSYVDPDYAARRESLFVVAVGCSHPSGTCFCTSMGTGPQVGPGADIAVVELLDPHRFVARAGTERGATLLAELASRPAEPADIEATSSVMSAAAARVDGNLGVDTTGLRDLLYASADHPRWAEVAERCLACTSCTMACPTCFCVTAVDSWNLDRAPERSTVWDSCFTVGHSVLGGRPVRGTTAARYRQWLTHKFASWVDQFGTSGCVGCGRCVTWCPAAIDVREELAALRGVDATGAGVADEEVAG